MAQTYKAILRGNQLEWLSTAPDTDSNHPKQVEVALDEQNLSETESSNGPAMASILETLAENDAVSEIHDPVEWQREIRQDRKLPGRDG